ncbi:DUF488 domain-containing protein [Sporolactobacillus spathodeae]|uniref:Uncharacterized protein YeaO (DUF488 family) n=1 Tax=Sporolactobacillus spathodeae TaxID=1465502 RepID=A0ABS2QCC4_9BACL|nr:DUF488 family protein [Sporolactobacillus spathodeae]MBM7659085.1 uncharacterized protein YeaO (DUF488 family) [Sporolactobacillus spathodeae]
MIQLKRIYDPAEPSDGLRILVDRLWPRGVTKERAQLDHWMKAVAPSSELRKWFHQQHVAFAQFKAAYEKELLEDNEKQTCIAKLAEWSHSQTVTLLYSAKDQQNNHAIIVLNAVLSQIQ